MIPDGSRGGSLPTLFEETGPARYLLWPSLMAAVPPQVVLARSFPIARPVRNVCMRGICGFQGAGLFICGKEQNQKGSFP